MFLAECEHQLQQVLDERTNVQDSLFKKENAAANLESEKQKLQGNIQKVHVRAIPDIIIHFTLLA